MLIGKLRNDIGFQFNSLLEPYQIILIVRFVSPILKNLFVVRHTLIDIIRLLLSFRIRKYAFVLFMIYTP